jgi:hypothetical protein
MARFGYKFCSLAAVSAPSGAAPEKIESTLLRSYFAQRSLFRSILMMIGGT